MPITHKSVIKKIQTTKWWAEEAPGSIFLFDYIMNTFVAAGKIMGYPTLSQHLYITKNNIAFEISPYEEKQKVFEEIYEKELKKLGYFLNLIKPWQSLRSDLIDLNKTAVEQVSKMSKSELYQFAKSFLQIGFDSVVYGAFIECVDPFTEYLPLKFQAKYNISDKDLQKNISTLAVQPERSFLTQEKLDFLNLSLGKISVQSYLDKWFWIQSNYRESVDITPKKLKLQIEREIKEMGISEIKKVINKTLRQEKRLIQKKKDLIRKLKLDKQDKILFRLLEQFALHIDLRKESMLRHTYARDKFLHILSRMLPYSLNELRSMRDNEVLDVIKGKKINIKKTLKRDQISVFYYTPTGHTEFQGKEALLIHDEFIQTLKSDGIKGVVASAPVKKVTGQASVIMDVNRQKFTPNTILVTSMTRPEFMPIRRKAKAVITDEGGITCHAAIVSRELNIPCIIGAKNATKLLKTGDQVEIDLTQGVIRKI